MRMGMRTRKRAQGSGCPEPGAAACADAWLSPFNTDVSRELRFLAALDAQSSPGPRTKPQWPKPVRTSQLPHREVTRGERLGHEARTYVQPPKVEFLLTEMERLVGAGELGVGGNQEFSYSVTFDVAETKPGGDVGKAAGRTNQCPGWRG